MKEYQCIIWYS